MSTITFKEAMKYEWAIPYYQFGLRKIAVSERLRRFVHYNKSQIIWAHLKSYWNLNMESGCQI